MQISQQLLSKSNHNRPGTKRGKTTAIACHYIGNPGTSAQANRNYFESLKNGQGTSASCHYIIGLQGEIIQLIPKMRLAGAPTPPTSILSPSKRATQMQPGSLRRPPSIPIWSCARIYAAAGAMTR